jgi:phospholipid/cholesterol/gamma-HCH transport system permease protein
MTIGGARRLDKNMEVISMSSGASVGSVPILLAPIGWMGRSAIGMLGYLGSLAQLILSAAFSPLRPARVDRATPFWRVMKSELWWLLVMGFPLVGLVHVGMGSFLSLQAYFGSTFVDGTGAVVGVGLLRNLASLMTGMSLAALLAGRIIPELVRQPMVAEEARSGVRGTTRSAPDRGGIAAPRMAAAAIASVLLALWGSAVGTVVGWQAAGSLIGLSTNMYFLMFSQMLWYRDVVGLLVKGVVFGLLSAAICCNEGLRSYDRRSTPESEGHVEHPGGDSDEQCGRIVRATCLSITAILLANMAWFLLVYHAVPVYGPSLLPPATP